MKKADSKGTPKETELAKELFQAWQTLEPLKAADFTYAATDDEAAYRIQEEFALLKNETAGGYKVSLTSKQTQQMFNSEEPLYGREMKSQFLTSPAAFPLSEMMSPLCEVELVFKAKEDLLPGDSLKGLLNKVTVAAGIEIPDSRFRDWFPVLSKYFVISDSAVAGRVIYAKELDAAKHFTVESMAHIACELKHNGETIANGKSSEVLGNPLNSLKWLVGKLAAQGKTLSAGQRVSSGTFVLPPALKKGTYIASYTNGLGDCKLTVE